MKIMFQIFAFFYGNKPKPSKSEMPKNAEKGLTVSINDLERYVDGEMTYKEINEKGFDKFSPDFLLSEYMRLVSLEVTQTFLSSDNYIKPN